MTGLPAQAPARRWRPGPLLPVGEGRDRALSFVIAVLCALACLTAILALAADRAASGWRTQISASATVLVRPGRGQTSSEAAAAAAEALAGVPGVTEARALDRADALRLLTPWLGGGVLPDDAPIPMLVAVDLDPRRPATSAALRAALANAGVQAVLDDHSRWLGDVERAALIARSAALGAGALVALAAGAAVAFATRAGLTSRRDVIEVLHLSGARDGFISGLFERRFAWLAARSGAYGALAAILLAGALKAFGGQDGFTPLLPLQWSDLLAAAPCPLAAAGVAVVSARRAALRVLRAPSQA